MADLDLVVNKTLVIGLGTTGTQICSQIAARIAWEYGDLRRTPWVRFLCLETNAAGRPAVLDPTDFIPAYDEAMKLSAWADQETLRKIPQKSVDDGVGNIRMVGRLALFHKRN